MACTSGTVSMGGQPALRATRLEAPSAPTTLSACNSSRCPAESTSTRRPRPFGASPRKRVSKERLAPARCALRASAGIRRDLSMMRSGRASTICAERPSVNSSNRRISLTMLSEAAVPSWVRNWSVTISERDAGSKPGLDSSTRTLRPPLATVAAVYKPAAEPPTTTTSPLSPPKRGRSSVLGTSALSRVTKTPWTFTWPDARAQNSQEYGLLSAQPGEVCDENGRADNPLSIAKPILEANPRSTFRAGGDSTSRIGGISRESGWLLRLTFIGSPFEKHHSAKHYGKRKQSHENCGNRLQVAYQHSGSAAQ